MKYIPNTMKFGNHSKSIINMIFEIADLNPKLKTWEDLVSKLKCTRFFLTFGTQNKSNMLIMNILIVIDDLDPKK